MKKLDVPITSASVELTEKCNLRCGYCFTYGIGKKDLNFNKGKSIVDWLLMDEVSQSDHIEISWWGGEPLLKFNLMRKLTDYAVSRAGSMGKSVSIGGTTNTTLVTPEVVDWMCQTRAYFLFTIDGIGRDHDVNRPTANGGSSWKLIEKNLPYMMEKIPFSKVRMSIAPNTIHNMFSNIKTLHEQFKINAIAFSPVYEMDWRDADIEECRRQLKMIVDYVVKRRKGGYNLAIKHLEDGAKAISLAQRRVLHPCGAGRTYIGITTEGLIYPCHRFHKFGNNFSGDRFILGNVDAGIIHPEVRDMFINFIPADHPGCVKGCEWMHSLCNMPCYAVAFDLTGDIHTVPPIYCKLWKLQSEAAKYLHDKLQENGFQIFAERPTGSCVCNNMCYSEHTDNEIITLNRNSKFACICNNTVYDGSAEAQARELTHQELQGKLQQVYISTPGEKMLKTLIKQLDRQTHIDTDLIAVINRLSDAVEKKGVAV